MTRYRPFAVATIVAAWLGLGCPAAAGDQTDIAGAWARADGTAKVDIAPCGDDLCAVNTWVKDPDGSEKVGDVLVMTLHPSGSDEFDGSAYDKRRDLTYSMHVTLKSGGLQTEGCVLFGVVCKTAEWVREL